MCLSCGIEVKELIAHSAVEVELKQGYELTRLEQAVRSVFWCAMGVEMVRQDLLALGDLFCNAILQLIIGAKISHTRIALHFHKATCDCASCRIQIKKCQICTFEADLIAQLFSMIFEYAVEIEVGIERYQNVISQNPLIVEIETCQC